MLRFIDAGESHGKALVGILEGMPAGLEIDVNFINKNLLLRQSGYGRGARQKIERDSVEFLSGIRFGKTIGSPITMLIKNRDFENWQNIMDAFGKPTTQKRITTPRPGHADLTGYIKYDRDDIRDVLERSSARQTAIVVATGAIAQLALEVLDVEIISFVKSIGKIKLNTSILDENLTKKIEQSPVFCPDERISDLMIAEIENAKKDHDSVGGSIEVIAKGIVPGLGSYVQWDRKLDAQLAHAIVSIQAIKAVEIGDGIKNAYKFGSLVHDEITYKNNLYSRKTNRAGGIEGGMSNGENIIIRAYMKPIPTLLKPLNSINVTTKKTQNADVERSDTCAVPAASIVVKNIVAFILLKAYMEKFGSDTMDELKKHVLDFKNYIKTK